jgi:hypothetical protein
VGQGPNFGVDEFITNLRVIRFPDAVERGIQAKWEQPLVTQTFSTILSRATDPLDQARLKAFLQPDAGDWLNALLSSQLGTLLDNESFRVISSLRLGVLVCQPH